jgi:4-oxalocrotonate tautomerase
MPLVNVHVLENVFSQEQKKQIITKLTDAMVSIEGEPFRSVTWVTINEVKEGSWGIAGHPLFGADVERIRKSKPAA